MFSLRVTGRRLASRWCRPNVIPRLATAGCTTPSQRLASSSTGTSPDLNIVQKKLFTPGPLGVSLTTKQAMLVDLGSRDEAFIRIVRSVRDELVELSGESHADFTCVPMQGSGTFAVESALTTSIPRTRPKVLVLANGSYGHRLAEVAKSLPDVDDVVKLTFPEDKPMDLDAIESKILEMGKGLTNVAAVHCETSSGQINPVEEIGQLVAKYAPQASYFIDAMSSFGAVPLSLSNAHCDFMVTSANKCLQGVPGFSLVFANKLALQRCGGNSRSLSLDLCKQYHGLEKDGQFRFTPPTHTILALHQALKELREEGGVEGRRERYQQNSQILRDNMAEMGFVELLDRSTDKSYIITSFLFPQHPNFSFKTFYSALSDRGFCIYPGKVTAAECFRIGTIGDLHPQDVRDLIAAILVVTAEMGIPVPLP